ncbi:MAG: glutamate--cysteine ligase, partial [Actinobacteria bacterium]|nr:glutamate--cysteine ligase [Actinomycetota bacterium]
MGRDVESATFTREQRQRYRDKVKTCLDVFEQMLASRSFDFDEPMTGMEIELNLVDSDYRPRMDNAEVLAAIADPEYQTELARFNIEFNVAPHRLHGSSAVQLEADLRTSLNEAERRCSERGAHIIMIGILPTVTPETFEGDWMSANTRYQALNDAVLAARGEDIHLDITGPSGERLLRYSDSLAPEAACTSMQLHLQVKPSEFAAHWNAAQVLAGPQLALGANSPYFMGKELWAETRIELFTQAADTRPVELKNQGVRPRVFFGERWITSIFDLFEENTRYFPAMLPELDDEDPQEAFAAG